jgi:hypothetical protein
MWNREAGTFSESSSYVTETAKNTGMGPKGAKAVYENLKV